MEFGSSFGVCLIVSLILKSSTWAVAPLRANGISTNALSVDGKVHNSKAKIYTKKSRPISRKDA
jgi:hypothetical protein